MCWYSDSYGCIYILLLLFEVQLLCLSLHIDALSFQDREWNRERSKMDCQMEKLEHFRHILLFDFNRGTKAEKEARNICAVYGDNAIGESTVRKWFSRFKEDRFHISDTRRSARPLGFDEYRLNTLIHNDPLQCTLELANVMNCDHPTIVRHLHSMDEVKKIGCMGIACSKSKPQKSEGGHMFISACSSSIGFWTTSTIAILYRYWWWEMVSLC